MYGTRQGITSDWGRVEVGYVCVVQSGPQLFLSKKTWKLTSYNLEKDGEHVPFFSARFSLVRFVVSRATNAHALLDHSQAYFLP